MILSLPRRGLVCLASLMTLAVPTAVVSQDGIAPPPRPPITPGALIVPAAPEINAPPETRPGPSPVAPIPEVWAPIPRDDQGRTAYGLYVAGRAAVSRGEGETGAAYLSAAQALTPEQPTVREQAFLSALISGDLDDAASAAPTGPEVSPALSEAGRLVSVLRTYARGDARAALAGLRDDPIRAPHAVAAVLVLPWIAAEAGDWDLALIEPSPGASDNLSVFIRFTRARLLEIRRRHDEADVEFRALPTSEPLFRLGHGAFLERRGRRDEALALYDAAIAAGARDGATAAARRRVIARGRAPALTSLRDGAAFGLTTAAQAAAAGGAAQFAAVYVRLALAVAPSDERRLTLGASLFAADLETAGRDALAQVGRDDPDIYALARRDIALSHAREDEFEQAVVEYRLAAAAAPDDAAIQFLLASTLVQLERHEEALTLLTGPVLNTRTQGAEIHFIRGAAFESLGRIPEAEAELWAALQKRPEEPTFLNYLGYLWVDSGRRVEEGAALIARAHAAEPQDGNIQDSLGWAQYRRGQYDVAVDTLEEAVAKEPANAEINDHLGDAYWQVGRRREAGFQWTRVLTLDPDAERRAEVERKLADGLAPPTPVSGGS